MTDSGGELPTQNALWREYFEEICSQINAGTRNLDQRNPVYPLEPGGLLAITCYLVHHLSPGSFYRAALAGDAEAMAASAHALFTQDHQVAIAGVVKLLVPKALRGSYEAVDAWIAADHTPDDWELSMVSRVQARR